LHCTQDGSAWPKKPKIALRYNRTNRISKWIAQHANRRIKRDNTLHMPTKVKARSVTASVAGKNGHSLINEKKFRQLYTMLLKYQLLEERLRLVSTDGTQAAGAVGVVLDLEREDTAVMTQRSLLAAIVKGVPVGELVQHVSSNGNGRATFSFPGANVLTPSSSTISAQLGLATGAALAHKLEKNGRVAVAFVEGDAARLIGHKEALELASDRKLPLLYVVDSRPNEKYGRALAEIAELFPVINVDADDVVAVYRVAQESIARVREGGGPAMIACMPYRLNGATESAVANMERYLAGKRLFRDKWKNEAIVEFTQEIGTASLR
jgi:TPP-dependent pyruvate/acetoin dehydrogenase alpha subunit